MNFSPYQQLVANFNFLIKAPADRELRVRLIQEEAEELLKAVEDRNVVELVDATCDLLYVTYGAADVLNMLLDTSHEEQLPPTGFLDWSKIVHETEDDFNLQVSEVVKELRNTKSDIGVRIELEELAQGLWCLGNEGIGIDLRPFFREVHRTNMLKLTGPVREDGKQLKPADWKPPRIEKMLALLARGLPVTCLGQCGWVRDPDNAHHQVRWASDPEGGRFCLRCGGLYVDL